MHKAHKDGHSPHAQTPGHPGHTAWTTTAICTIGSLLDPFDAISGELADGTSENITEEELKRMREVLQKNGGKWPQPKPLLNQLYDKYFGDN